MLIVLLVYLVFFWKRSEESVFSFETPTGVSKKKCCWCNGENREAREDEEREASKGNKNLYSHLLIGRYSIMQY